MTTFNNTPNTFILAIAFFISMLVTISVMAQPANNCLNIQTAIKKHKRSNSPIYVTVKKDFCAEKSFTIHKNNKSHAELNFEPNHIYIVLISAENCITKRFVINTFLPELPSIKQKSLRYTVEMLKAPDNNIVHEQTVAIITYNKLLKKFKHDKKHTKQALNELATIN